jgi:hypothetical protein
MSPADQPHTLFIIIYPIKVHYHTDESPRVIFIQSSADHVHPVMASLTEQPVRPHEPVSLLSITPMGDTSAEDRMYSMHRFLSPHAFGDPQPQNSRLLKAMVRRPSPRVCKRRPPRRRGFPTPTATAMGSRTAKSSRPSSYARAIARSKARMSAILRELEKNLPPDLPVA